ncbi:hypothetical protein [Tateyamaria sp.]|uniref:hypothetical protein n=1 Tax=Tateyamaria sp. TaxID=1929288 RepID=UPI00329CBE21
MRIITLLLLSSVAVQAADQSRIDLFLTLVRDSDCQMSDAQASKILPANNFTRAEVSEIEKILDEAGMVDKTKMGVFALTKAGCKG